MISVLGHPSRGGSTQKEVAEPQGSCASRGGLTPLHLEMGVKRLALVIKTHVSAAGSPALISSDPSCCSQCVTLASGSSSHSPAGAAPVHPSQQAAVLPAALFKHCETRDQRLP